MTAIFLSNSNSEFCKTNKHSFEYFIHSLLLIHIFYYIGDLLLLLLTENQWVKEFQIEVKSDFKKDSSDSRL